jgi:hypothetical protein
MARDYRARNPAAEASTMFMTPVSSQTSRAAIQADDMSPWVVALSCWLVTGVAALVCVPELRGSDPLFGWLPFWLIVAPAIDLAVLRHRSLIARTRQLLVRVGRRRGPVCQAKPLRRRPRTTRRAQPLARKMRTRSAAPGISAIR